MEHIEKHDMTVEQLTEALSKEGIERDLTQQEKDAEIDKTITRSARSA